MSALDDVRTGQRGEPTSRECTARERTPRGAGAVSIVELSGRGAVEHARALAGLARLAVGDLRFARIAFACGVVDEALLVCIAPDRVELHLHGSPAVVRAACAGLEAPRAVPETLEDRARALLERAPCEAAARILLDQSEGALRRELEVLCDLAPDGARALSGELAARGRRARFALEPARIVLAGPVNAGKSTLFNVLAGVDRALVADEPGTTRDVLVADGMLGAWPVRVFDTAGERELEGDARHRAIEGEGQRRARLARGGADLVLWLVPVDAVEPGASGLAVPASAVALWTQADRAANAPAGSISARADPVRARARVSELLHERFDLPVDPWVPGRAVPFDPELVADLDRCSFADADPRARVRAWLVPR
jgi:hypothetical protein